MSSAEAPGEGSSGIGNGVSLILTAGGLACGFYSLVATLREDFVVAAIAIIVANFFDVLDGFNQLF